PLNSSSSLIFGATKLFSTERRRNGVCVFSVASRNTTQNSASFSVSIAIGNLSPPSERVDRQKIFLYFLSTMMCLALESAYSPLKSIRKNFAFFLNFRLLLYFSKSSRYILASVYDFPLPVFPKIPMWQANRPLTPTRIS